jgi:hypothetical protein
MPAAKAKRKPKIAEIHEISDLIVETDLNNARIHDEGNIELIERSLADVGLSRSIVIDEAGHVLAGKGTTSAAMRAGFSKIQVVDVDGDTLVAVRRTGLSAVKKKRLAVFDNKTTDTSMFDFSALGELYQDGVLDGIFPDGELLQLVDPDALAMQMIAEAGAALPLKVLRPSKISLRSRSRMPYGLPTMSGTCRCSTFTNRLQRSPCRR